MLGRALQGALGGADVPQGPGKASKLAITTTLKDDKVAYDEYERFNKLASEQKARLKKLHEQEMKNMRFNKLKIMNKWRQFMREEKKAELRKQIEILAQDHERKVDRADMQIQTLVDDIERLEEQFQVAQRSHTRKMGELMGIHQQRLDAFQQEFEDELQTLKQEFDAERTYMVTRHQREVREMKEVMGEVANRENDQAETQKQTHETEREEIRNRNLEDINILKISLEAEIEEYEKQFDEAHDRYIESTEDKNREFTKLKEKDTELSGNINNLLTRIEKLQTALSAWRKKMGSNEHEYKDRNDTLRKEKEEIARHYRQLKARMDKFRKGQTTRLYQLTAMTRNCSGENQDKLHLAESILKLAEICRKMETEKEKIMPFYETTTAPEPPGEMRVDVADGIEIREEWMHLDNFYKKFNKALLDKMAVQQMRDQFQAENTNLRSILKQYLDGITVTEDAVDRPNPLLVVNGRVNLVDDRVRPVVNQMITEGNRVVNNYKVQRRYK